MFRKLFWFSNEEEEKKEGEKEKEETTPNDSSSPMSEEEIRKLRLARFNQKQTKNETPEESKSSEIKKNEEKEIVIPTPTLSVTKEEVKKSKKSSVSPHSPQGKSNWEHNFLSRVFSVTLQPEESSSSVSYLKFLANDLISSNEPLILCSYLMDRLVVEKLTFYSCNEQFIYLMKVLKTIKSESRVAPKSKKNFVQTVESLVLNYSLLLLEKPNIFLSENESNITCNPIEELMTCLGDNTLPSGYMNEVIDVMQEKGNLKDLVLPLFHTIHDKLKTMNLLSEDLMLYINIFSELMSFPHVATIIIDEIPGWLANNNANGFEVQLQTYLGSILSFGCIPSANQSTVAVTHFQNSENLLNSQRQAIYDSLRRSMDAIVQQVNSLVKNLLVKLKENDKGKEAWLSFAAQALNSNREYSKMRYNAKIVADRPLLLNIGSVLLNFSEPIIRQGSKSFSKIDPAYFQSGIRINVEDDTKLSVNSEQLESWVDKRNLSNIETWKRANPGIPFDPEKFKKLEKAGFTTECFFLSYYALHLGYISCIRDLRELYKLSGDLKSQRNALAGTPDVNRIDTRISNLETAISCYQVQLHNYELAKTCGRFYLFACQWLKNLIDPKNKGLPLDPPTMEYGTMPEFILEDIAEYFITCIRVFRNFTTWFSLKDIIPLIVLLVGSPSYVKNPYLRARLLEILYELVLLPKVEDLSTVRVLMETDKYFCRDFSSVLFQMYIDIEHTGSHTQFYRKFPVREYIREILTFMWKSPILRDCIIKASHGDNFVKFISNVMSDSIYLLDEGLQAVTKIRSFQLEFKDTPTWNSLSSAVQEEKQKEYSKEENSAKYFLRGANSALAMFQCLTTSIKEPFMLPLLVSRIADMVNLYLEQLVGPKCLNLKVDNPEKYFFDPKKLLGILVDIYLNLWDPTFISAVGNDPRCYSHTAFLRASEVISKTGIRSEDIANKLVQFANEVKNSVEEQIEIDFPDEFLDPITYTVMSDPVKLPTGMTVDRSSILTHLMSKSTDPFTNQPLTEADLVPDDDMKQKIEAFIRDQKKKAE